jgi:hypothetical protein
VKKRLAKLHIILGAFIVGGKFYGWASPGWGVGVFVSLPEEPVNDVTTVLVPTGESRSVVQ